MTDGRLKLIDGHLRRDLDPDMEVLDVTDEEARALLLSIDPLAALAQTQEQLHQRLLELTPVASEDLRAAWEAAATAHLAAQPPPRPEIAQVIPEQYLILVSCRDEQHRVERLARLAAEGLPCRALLSWHPWELPGINLPPGGGGRGVIDAEDAAAGPARLGAGCADGFLQE